jgi:hypothetical protein
LGGIKLPRPKINHVPSELWGAMGGFGMGSWQAMLLGAMLVLLPSMIVLAWLLVRDFANEHERAPN